MDPTRMFNECIEALYAAVLDDDAWRRGLERLTELIGCEGALLQVLDSATGQEIHSDSIRLPPLPVAEYLTHWLAQDCRLQAGLNRPVGEVMTDQTLLPARVWRTSAIYNEFFLPTRVTQTMVLWLDRGPQRSASIAFHRQETDAPFAGTESQRLLSVWRPLRRTLAIRERLSTADVRAQRLSSAFDRLPYGVFLLDATGCILDSSHRARGLLAMAEDVTVRHGRLRFADPLAQARLDRCLADGARGAASDAPSVLLPLRHATGTRRSALIVPARLVRTAPLGPRVAVCVMIFDPPAAPVHGVSHLSAHWGLTAAETRLVSMLAGGHSLREAATLLTVSPHTARTHLKRVLHKTGCRRQSDLIRRVIHASPPRGELA